MPSLLQFASRVWQYTRRHPGAFFISVSVTILSLTLYVSVYLVSRPNPWLRFLIEVELGTLDMRFRLRGPTSPDPRIVIVAIDQKSEDVLGHWPFPRSRFAETVDFLREAGARVIAFDINFPQPDENSALLALERVRKDYAALRPTTSEGALFQARLDELRAQADNDQKFADALSRFDNAILGSFFLFSQEEVRGQDQQRVKEYLNYLSFQAYPQVLHPEYGKLFDCPRCEAEGISPNLPKFAQYAKNFGFFNAVPDSDGTVRRAPVIIRFQQNYYPSLDIAAVLAYTNRPLDEVAVVFNRNGLERIDFGPVTIPTDPEGCVQIDFHGPTGTYPTYSIADVVERRLPASLFRDRIVLIGPTALGIGDMRSIPLETTAFPGVEVHANFIDNLLRGDFIRRGLRQNLMDVVFILLFSLPGGMLFSAARPSRATAVLVATLVVFLGWAYYLFAAHRIWIVTFLPTATLLVTYGSIISYRYFFEEREKKVVRGAFQQYMEPQVIEQLLRQPELLHLGGEEREITAMFADIRGFTSLSEGLAPHALVELLNEYLSEMTQVVFDLRGTLDKYIGDAIMAFWGAPLPQPDHPERACRAALEMLQVLAQLQTRWAAQGRPRIDIGIGISTGRTLVGNMGSARRFNYTIMGDNVNLASRLEGLNKSFGTHFIISESTHQSVRDLFVVRELDLIRVKGKRNPVRIYEVLGPIEWAERFRALIERFEVCVTPYREGEWERALGLFGDLLRDYPEDGPTRLFIDRCWQLIQEPPEEKWEGVFVMTTK